MQGYVGVPLEAKLAQGPLKEAHAVFCYSTAWPSPDGLRLPELSAALSVSLQEGALVITTDKWLVGPRFSYEGMEVVQGDDGENIVVSFWRVVGQPLGAFLDLTGVEALRALEADYMGEDACAENPAACMDFMGYLESQQ
eukprot:gnl/TRDRNA2_/TRDRNA2_138673_c1_seq1.p1 gnl/TRDRNA2_/TRDRNA2_138673_c1~~gnl/TRDRNA2_/TRDRNA2_138673_c1_seq1.p1  ORF type:complete len:163 (-),score=30.60 gnl/TRDRNA2_/TRDRNA2_138673_c1_seq1:18-437(-)